MHSYCLPVHVCFLPPNLINKPYLFSATKAALAQRWPAHLALPMILMRDNFRKSIDFSVVKPRQKSNDGAGFDCPDCGRVYKLKSSLRNHQKWECGKEPQFSCPYCTYRAKQKMHIARHIERMHKEIDYTAVNKEKSLLVETTESD